VPDAQKKRALMLLFDTIRQFIEKSQAVTLEAKLKGVRFDRRRAIDRRDLLSPWFQERGATKIFQQQHIARSPIYKILNEETILNSSIKYY
jgi:hypothetical protein